MNEPSPAALLVRVRAFLAGSAAASFEELALEAFRLQCRLIPAWSRFCAVRGVDPVEVERWQDVPALPVFAFRYEPLHLAEPREIFRSSGTTGGPNERSVHHHPFPELYRQAIELGFAPAVFGSGSDPEPASTPASDQGSQRGEAPLNLVHPPLRPRRGGQGGEVPALSVPKRPLLSLVPAREDVPDSSLGFWAEHIVARHGAQGSVVAMTSTGVDLEAADAFSREAARRGGPVSVLATVLALLDWLERGDPAPLPPGSTLVETGGFKGRRRAIERQELLALVEEKLGLPPSRVVREYGMSELTGHCYTRVLAGGDPDLFVPPHYMRVRPLDPETLEEARPGQPGLLSIFDLANLGSACHLLTQDLGVAEAGGFRLLGRAEGAALRGCSLTAEELARGGARGRA
jgi:hypothetical protein